MDGKLSNETIQAMKNRMEAWNFMHYDPEDEDDYQTILARDGFRLLLERHLKDIEEIAQEFR